MSFFLVAIAAYFVQINQENMHDLTINGRGYQVAESWNELTRRQLLRIIRVLLMPMDPQAIKMRILHELLPLPTGLFFALEDSQITWLLRLAGFVTEEATLTRNLLPEIRLPILKTYRWQQLHGPADRLGNLVMAEFIFTESFFLAWHHSQNQDYLDNLIAILYRPQREGYDPASPDYKGDRREDFNPHLFEKRAQSWVKHLSKPVKMAVLYYYAGCRQALIDQYPEVFGGEETGGPASASPLRDMLHDLPNDKFGTIDEAEKAPLHTVLYEINKANKRAREAKTN